MATYDSQTEIANRHDFRATVSKSYTQSQSQTTFLSPSSGERLIVTGGFITTDTTSGRILIYFRDSGVVIADLYPNNSGQQTFPLETCLFIGREDDPLMVTTTTGANNVFVSLNVNEGERDIPIGTSTSTTSSTSTSTTAT